MQKGRHVHGTHPSEEPLCECELERAAMLQCSGMLKHWAELEARQRNNAQPMCSECTRPSKGTPGAGRAGEEARSFFEFSSG